MNDIDLLLRDYTADVPGASVVVVRGDRVILRKSSTVVNRAYGYSREGSSWHRTDQSKTSAVLGDGGIYASADELVNWIRALDGGQFAEASVPRVDTATAGVKYGFGWRISEHQGSPVVAHAGETRGFRNALVRFPDQKLTVILLTNRNEGEPYDIAMKIADRMR